MTAYEMRISDWSSDVCTSDLISREWSKRPDDVDQIFMLALGAIPHVMIAMGKLPRHTGMDFDRLRHIELNPVARAAEYGLIGAEGRRLRGESFSMGSSFQEPAEPLRAATPGVGKEGVRM